MILPCGALIEVDFRVRLYRWLPISTRVHLIEIYAAGVISQIRNICEIAEFSRFIA